MSYSAIVARIHTRPHPNADRLLLGTVCGHQVVVGTDTVDGELGVFFPADGQLSEEMVIANDLYSKAAIEKLYPDKVNRVLKFGFFSEKRRVRAQSFRGERSDGFWCPLSYLRWAIQGAVDQPGLLNEGDELTALNGHEVCTKYMTPATQRAQRVPGRKQRENACFPKHDDTKQFKYVSEHIPPDAVIYITEKLHGTSGRYGRVLDDVGYRFPRFMALVSRLRVCVGARPVATPREYRYLNGSKNVILEKTAGAGYYGTNEFRYRAIEGVTLHKGEILYFEIVGFVQAPTITSNENGTIYGAKPRPIMDPQPIKDDLKALRKTYGDVMTYRYGLPETKCDIYVYKILHVNEDGVTTDMSWQHVKARCAQLGLKHVPELVGPISFVRETAEGSVQVRAAVETYVDGPSTLDESHIREGVVVRVESTRGIDYLKHKSWTFGVLEGYIKDTDTYVDTEEIA